jgi:exopolysaccharide production protein ExoZ
MKSLLSIQYMRAGAALAVVAYHSGRATILGQVGVDIFFVISGFLMWAVTAKATGALEFLSHRMVRIVPLYWIAILAMAVVLGSPVADTIRSLLFWPYRGADGQIFPVLIQGWTLNYEMFFYVIFAATLLLPRKLRLIFLTISLCGLSVAGFAFRPSNSVIATYTSPMLLEFLGGVWLSEAWLRGLLPSTRNACVMLGLGLSVILISLLGGQPLMDRAFVWGIPSLFVITGVIAIETRHGMPTIGPLKLLGDASYSIYLFHTFLLTVVARLMAGEPAILVVTAIVTVGAGMGLTAFYVIEKPITEWFKVYLRRTPIMRVAT